MTKKHFIALAREISKITDAEARKAAAQAVINVARECHDNFKEDLFRKACGA